MDGSQFDQLARQIGHARSRRAAGLGLAGVVVAVVGSLAAGALDWRDGPDAAAGACRDLCSRGRLRCAARCDGRDAACAVGLRSCQAACATHPATECDAGCQTAAAPCRARARACRDACDDARARCRDACGSCLDACAAAVAACRGACPGRGDPASCAQGCATARRACRADCRQAAAE